MKKIISKIAIVILFGAIAACKGKKLNEISLEGKFKGENITVQNPYGPKGIGFCVTDVYVNDKMTSDEINAETFEIDIKAMGVKEGDNVSLRIVHTEGCEPKIVNPEALR